MGSIPYVYKRGQGHSKSWECESLVLVYLIVKMATVLISGFLAFIVFLQERKDWKL